MSNLRDNMVARILAAMPGFDASKMSDEKLQARYDEVIAAAAAPAATAVLASGAASTLPYVEVKPAEVLGLFRGQGIKVQFAHPVKVKGDDGKERDGYEVEKRALDESGVLSAKRWDNGRVTITTIDGKGYTAGAKAA